MTTNYFNKSSKRPSITEDEVKNIINIGEKEGSIKASEREMINNIFRFDDITVGNIMIHRPDIFALEENKTVGEVRNLIIKEGFSRIPVYRKDFDNVQGVLFVKDLIKSSPNQKIKEFLRSVLFVPKTKKINSLFHEMNSKKTHIALVVDEYGVVLGLVTIEDLIEEIVGEIYDETDEVKKQFKKLDSNLYLVEGTSEIKEINKKLKLNISGDIHKSISAFVLDKLERIPNQGEELILPDCQIFINKVKDHQIKDVRIKIIKKSKSKKE